MQYTLDCNDYARALANVLSFRRTQTPISIGILAPRGRGKTTLIRLIEDQLEKIPDNHPYRVQTISIRVNALEFSKTAEIWSTLYSLFESRTEGSLSWWQKPLFRLELWQTVSPLSFWTNYALGLIGIFLFLIVIILFFVWLVVPSNLFSIFLDMALPAWLTHFENYLTLYRNAIAIPIVGISVSTIRWIWKNAFGGLADKVLKDLIASGSKHKPRAEHQIPQEVDLVRRIFKRRSRKRIVIFVDDIDKSSTRGIAALVESIAMLLQNPDTFVVWSMETNFVKRALSKQYAFLGYETSRRGDIGRRYLDKLIQIPFHIPEFVYDRRQDLPDSTLENCAIERSKPTKEAKESNGQSKTEPTDRRIPRNIRDDQSTTYIQASLGKEERDLFRTILNQPELEFSPRLLKRLINIYFIARQLYQPQLPQEESMAAAPPEKFHQVAGFVGSFSL